MTECSCAHSSEENNKSPLKFQRLWSYDLIALYKSFLLLLLLFLAHQHKACRQLKIKQEMTAVGELIGGIERAEERDRISPLKGNGQALEQKYLLLLLLLL